MGNPRELRLARRKAGEAMAILASVEALPRRVGAQVRWLSNGLVWTRAGDNDWRTDSDPTRPFPTAHIASIPWEVHHG